MSDVYNFHILSNCFRAPTFSAAAGCWGFYKTAGGVCFFSPALQSPSRFQIFLESCLAAWLKWKTDNFLSSKKNESLKGRRENREPWWGVFGEFSRCFGCHSLIWVGGNAVCYLSKSLLPDTGPTISSSHGHIGMRCYGHSNVSLGKIMKNVEQ